MALAVTVGGGRLLGTGVRVGTGVLVPQEASTNITKVERNVFTVDMLSSLTFRPTMCCVSLSSLNQTGYSQWLQHQSTTILL